MFKDIDLVGPEDRSGGVKTQIPGTNHGVENVREDRWEAGGARAF